MPCTGTCIFQYDQASNTWNHISHTCSGGASCKCAPNPEGDPGYDRARVELSCGVSKRVKFKHVFTAANKKKTKVS